jgi:hypothetical protein
MIVTVTGQFLENQEHASYAQTEKQRYEKQLSGAYYAALSTQGTRVDVQFWISMEDLKNLELEYAKRLDAIYRDPNQKGCAADAMFDVEKVPGLRVAVEYTVRSMFTRTTF